MKYDENTVYYDDTLMTYVRENKDKTFQEYPFQDADALLLCQMAYPKLEYFVPKLSPSAEKASKRIHAMGLSPKAIRAPWLKKEGRKSGRSIIEYVANIRRVKNPAAKSNDKIKYRPPHQSLRTIGWKNMDTPSGREKLFGGSFYGKMYADLFDEMKDSPRYGGICIELMRVMTDKEKVVQFAAVTFRLDEESAMVVFRGTDSSLIGWKEDFKYSYLRSWPSHALAQEYLTAVAPLLPEKIYVGGHSKGGNLAVFAAAQAAPPIQSRIARVYNFDGMGFRPAFYRTEGYAGIRDKVCKLVPAESLIGMLFAPERSFRIVESYEHGFLQHDLMNWKIKEGKFVLQENFEKKHLRRINRLNRWIKSFTARERKELIDLLFRSFGELLEKEGAQTMVESGSPLKLVRQKVKAMTKAERDLFRRSLLRFALPRK